MSTIEVKVPDIGDFTDVPVIEVLVKAGDKVKVDDSLVTLESDKATMDVPSTVAGTVKDTQGGIIPGATVTLVSETRGTTFESVAGNTGDFVISNVPADTYTIRVTMDGFKTTERKGVPVSLGERVAGIG